MPRQARDAPKTEWDKLFTRHGVPETRPAPPECTVPMGEAVPADWIAEPPPPQRWLWRDCRTSPIEGDGDGVLPRGKVGLVVGAGGVSKTMALVQAAVSLAACKPFLGAWQATKPGRVLLLLGEEDAHEVRRRLYRACRVVGSIPPAGSIHVAALAGQHVAMLTRGANGDPFATPYFAAVLAHVRATGPWDLIVIDPLSRFAGAEAETSNAWGTRFVSILEELAAASGATVLCAHHSAQWGRRSKSDDATITRGVTGLSDGARWVATLVEDEDATVSLRIAKSNYAPKGEPILCRRAEGGTLVVLSGDEASRAQAARAAATPQAKRQAEKEADEGARRALEDAAVLAAVAETPGIVQRKLENAVCAAVHCSKERAAVAIARVRPHLVVRDGTRGAKLHFPGQSQGPSPVSVSGVSPLVPPRVPGTVGRIRPPGLTVPRDSAGQSGTVVPLFPEEES